MPASNGIRPKRRAGMGPAAAPAEPAARAAIIPEKLRRV
jgi:hypothetical protein